MSRFEKEVLPFIEEEIMRKLRTYNVYSIKEYEDIRKAVRYSIRFCKKNKIVRYEDKNLNKATIAQNYNTDVYSISAPTQSIAQKWLRETKNLHIEIYRSAVGYGYAIVKADNGTWQEDDDSRGPNDGGLWDTYEEALEAGIREALKLII